MQLKLEIQINAPKQKVWEILTNFSAYPNWNPFIKSIKGDFIEGKKVEVHIVPLGTIGMIIKPRVLCFKIHEEIRWQGNLLFPGLFDGEHIFQLREIDSNTTLFIHSENFKGILIPFFKKMLDQNTRDGFNAMNEKLKELCER